MKKTLLFPAGLLVLALLLAGSRTGRAQAPAWQLALPVVATSTGGSAYALVNATATDAAGDVYVAGEFAGQLTLGAITLSGPASSQGFLAKWSPASGRYVWAQRVDGYSATALAVSSGSVYVAGVYLGNATFGATTLANYDAQGYSFDVFVAKLADAGSSASYVWAQRAGGTDSDGLAGLAVSGAAVYLAVNFQSVTSNFGAFALPNTRVQPGYALSDVGVARLTDAGSTSAYAWAVGAGGASDDRAAALVASGSTLYVAGRFDGTATFPGAPALSSAGGNGDAFVARLADAGTSARYDWALRLGTADYEGARCLALNGPALYVAGEYTGATLPIGSTTLPSAGDADAFVAQLTPTAAGPGLGWAQHLGGPNGEFPTALLARGGSVYVAGAFNYVATGHASNGPGTCTAGSYTLTSAGESDDFVVRLAGAGGSVVWAQRAGGGGGDEPAALTSSGTSLYLGGNLFGPTASFGAYTVSNPGSATQGPAGFLAALPEPALPTSAPAALAGLAVFPNPARGLTAIRVPAGTGAATLLLLDALGRPVRRASVPAGQEYALDLAGLTPGVYALRVEAGAAQTVRRLVVE